MDNHNSKQNTIQSNSLLNPNGNSTQTSNPSLIQPPQQNAGQINQQPPGIQQNQLISPRPPGITPPSYSQNPPPQLMTQANIQKSISSIQLTPRPGQPTPPRPIIPNQTISGQPLSPMIPGGPIRSPSLTNPIMSNPQLFADIANRASIQDPARLQQIQMFAAQQANIQRPPSLLQIPQMAPPSLPPEPALPHQDINEIPT